MSERLIVGPKAHIYRKIAFKLNSPKWIHDHKLSDSEIKVILDDMQSKGDVQTREITSARIGGAQLIEFKWSPKSPKRRADSNIGPTSPSHT